MVVVVRIKENIDHDLETMRGATSKWESGINDNLPTERSSIDLICSSASRTITLAKLMMFIF